MSAHWVIYKAIKKVTISVYYQCLCIRVERKKIFLSKMDKLWTYLMEETAFHVPSVPTTRQSRHTFFYLYIELWFFFLKSKTGICFLFINLVHQFFISTDFGWCFFELLHTYFYSLCKRRQVDKKNSNPHGFAGPIEKSLCTCHSLFTANF